jgi:acyl-CoA thioester hydrolase
VPFTHELRVRYGECDPQGIVFNANYLAYFDIAVTELCREAIGPWQTMVDRGVDMVVAEASLSFRRPARFDDVLGLEARVGTFGTTSMTTEVAIRRGDELLVEGWLRQVWVDAKTWEKTPIPDWAREGLNRFS